MISSLVVVRLLVPDNCKPDSIRFRAFLVFVPVLSGCSSYTSYCLASPARWQIEMHLCVVHLLVLERGKKGGRGGGREGVKEGGREGGREEGRVTLSEGASGDDSDSQRIRQSKE